MFNPNDYVMPRVSKQERILKKHGYSFGRTQNGVMSLIKNFSRKEYLDSLTQKEINEFRSELAIARGMSLSFISDEEIKDYMYQQMLTAKVMLRYDEALYSLPNESFKDWMIRLGWLVRNEEGKLVEA